MQRKGEIDREIDAEASGDCFFAYITYKRLLTRFTLINTTIKNIIVRYVFTRIVLCLLASFKNQLNASLIDLLNNSCE